MILKIPEWLRKTFGILGTIMLYLGTSKPLMSMPAGVYVTSVGFVFTTILLCASLYGFSIFLLASLYIGGLYFLYSYATCLCHDDTVRVFAFMGLLIYIACTYLVFRVMQERSDRNNYM